MLKDTINIICVFLVLVLISNIEAPTVIQKPDTVAVVYESSDIIPEPYVTGGLGSLQADGLQTRIFDKDIVTGTGQVPKALKDAIEAASRNGLPALVVLSNGKVIKVQDLPKTASEIIEAVK
tara:strand:+ start:263 stop:628 length:366 start_codon:yes stop_codon:yes gene_type:complete